MVMEGAHELLIDFREETLGRNRGTIPRSQAQVYGQDVDPATRQQLPPPGAYPVPKKEARERITD